METISMGSDVTVKIYTKFFGFSAYWRKNGNTIIQYISYSQISRKSMIWLEGKPCTTISLHFGY
jgi:hypothetical protein